MRTTTANNGSSESSVLSNLDLQLVVSDLCVLSYLSQFESEDIRCEKALEALKVGVIAIQSASPTLDTQVVQSKFAEVESRVRDQLAEFQRTVTADFTRYFSENDGVLPRSINGVFGEGGALNRTFQIFFDPTGGRLARLMQDQIGPQSTLGKTLDPQNKQGVVALIENRVQQLLQAKLDEVLNQFSLDTDGSAMCRLKVMLSDFFTQMNQSLGIRAAVAVEAERGHVKGIVFEDDLYGVFAQAGSQLGDETELVRGTNGTAGRCKKGDFVATLGESSGAPGLRVVVEVKNQPMRFKDAMEELQEAKKNRAAVSGILAFARGCEPAEIGDFRRVGEDFYVTVDKEDLAAGKPLMFLDAAYRIARALVVTTQRKEAIGELDLQKIEDQISGLALWSDRIADLIKKARTINGHGKAIEETAIEFKAELDSKAAAILDALRRASAG